MAVAALGLAVANSPLAELYFYTLHRNVGGLDVLHRINDGLIAVFFLLVGLEIKREVVDGELSSWSRRILPGAAAAGGMLAPALIYLAVQAGDPTAASGWAIPAATDIAFALGILSLLGKRLPVSLKVFLTALAIIDDLGAVLIIAFFYTSDLNVWAMGGAAAAFATLLAMNRLRVAVLFPYLAVGAVLWWLHPPVRHSRHACGRGARPDHSRNVFARRARRTAIRCCTGWSTPYSPGSPFWSFRFSGSRMRASHWSV